MKLKYVLALLFVTAIVSFSAGWVVKPKPAVLTDSTIVTAKLYCEKTIPTLPPGKEKEVMIQTLYNLKEGNINWSESLSQGKGVNYRMIRMFADMYDLQKTVDTLPKGDKITS